MQDEGKTSDEAYFTVIVEIPVFSRYRQGTAIPYNVSQYLLSNMTSVKCTVV